MEMDSLYWNMMDKNKSTFKLKGIGPIYYLNLDGQPERREYMENQFKYWEVDNYERISAYDGRDDDLSAVSYTHLTLPTILLV